ncbi:hypothetical protein M404DRAFT_1002110 [Pisolithus tinctorius Marx 270]|uniref:Uncharacterized protein n=1 Tax=Pisolithus tinctorius Marx 270 TaxID=870435 RepID=A0A0C3J083_PISTI|nr:hypothetical protein M404DRAFT_1002110 [Pisolithus tinctorius Marx 270]
MATYTGILTVYFRVPFGALRLVYYDGQARSRLQLYASSTCWLAAVYNGSSFSALGSYLTLY